MLEITLDKYAINKHYTLNMKNQASIKLMDYLFTIYYNKNKYKHKKGGQSGRED